MTARFPVRSAATLVGAGVIAGIGLKSGLGLGTFLGCIATTVATVGAGFLSEALRNRQGLQCPTETCAGFCDAVRSWGTIPASGVVTMRSDDPGSGGIDLVHGGGPP